MGLSGLYSKGFSTFLPKWWKHGPFTIILKFMQINNILTTKWQDSSWVLIIIGGYSPETKLCCYWDLKTPPGVWSLILKEPNLLQQRDKVPWYFLIQLHGSWSLLLLTAPAVPGDSIYHIFYELTWSCNISCRHCLARWSHILPRLLAKHCKTIA